MQPVKYGCISRVYTKNQHPLFRSYKMPYYILFRQLGGHFGFCRYFKMPLNSQLEVNGQ